MKTYLFAPINNECLCLDLQLAEGANWIDEVHVTEVNMNFQGGAKDFMFHEMQKERLKVHSYDGSSLLKYDWLSRKIGVYSKKDNVFAPFIKNRFGRVRMTWYNEAIQRNCASNFFSILSDEDIVILSDIDEIIDSRFSDQIISEVKKRGIITIKLHFTLFFLNLFSKNWGGPRDYSYRTFVMTGKYFKSLKYSSDYLRKLGENNKLLNEIYCPDEIMGFHHSWLGDEAFISEKLSSYAHVEHKGLNSANFIKQCLREKKSIFPGHELYADSNIPLLRSVEMLRITENNFFI